MALCVCGTERPTPLARREQCGKGCAALEFCLCFLVLTCFYLFIFYLFLLHIRDSRVYFDTFYTHGVWLILTGTLGDPVLAVVHAVTGGVFTYEQRKAVSDSFLPAGFDMLLFQQSIYYLPQTLPVIQWKNWHWSHHDCLHPSQFI